MLLAVVAAGPTPGTVPGAFPPPSPFALARGHDDTALFQDGRAAFSHLLPGHPRFAPAGFDPHGPFADAVVVLEDAPIVLRYRLEPPRVNAPTAQDVAHLTAIAEAHARAGANVASATVDHANPTWLGAWGVEGAAVAAYDVAPLTPNAPPEREDLFVLVRGGLVLTVRWTYPRALLSDPVYALFASVAEATMVWDPQRWQEQQRARVWPESALLGPGLRAGPLPAPLERTRELAGVQLAPEERAALLGVLSTVVSNAGAPWVPISPAERGAATGLLVSATQDARLHAFVASLADDVRCAHDLRGAALLLARAVLDPTRTSSRPPSGSASAPPRKPPPVRVRGDAAGRAPMRTIPPQRAAPPPLPPRKPRT